MAKTEVELFRAVRIEQFPDGVIVNDKPAIGILYPDFHSRTLPNGRTREADVDLTEDKSTVLPGGGTSLFDKPNVFKSKGWLSFCIPKATIVPDQIQVKYTNRNSSFDADHYQIECVVPMRIDAFKGALDNLARNAVVRAVEIAHQGIKN